MPKVFFKMPGVLFQECIQGGTGSAAFFALLLNLAENWTSEYVMTFFAFHVTLGGKQT